MKIALVLARIISFDQLLTAAGLGCSSFDSNEDVVTISSDIKRGAEYRNALFGVYVCHVKKAT